MGPNEGGLWPPRGQRPHRDLYDKIEVLFLKWITGTLIQHESKKRKNNCCRRCYGENGAYQGKSPRVYG